MSDSRSSGASGGIGFFGILAIVFIVLKLCGVINWSWLWVLAPLWGPIALVLAILLLIGVCVGTIALFAGILALLSK